MVDRWKALLIDRLFDRFDRLIDWLMDWLNDWIIVWLFDGLIDCCIDCLNRSLDLTRSSQSQRKIKWTSGTVFPQLINWNMFLYRQMLVSFAHLLFLSHFLQQERGAGTHREPCFPSQESVAAKEHENMKKSRIKTISLKNVFAVFFF